MTTPHKINYRQKIRRKDVEVVREIVSSSNFFNPEEIEVAVELAKERLRVGTQSGYYFLFAENEGRVIGYTCFGPIFGTQNSYDLYWIAIHQDFRFFGLGKRLAAESERIMTGMGAGRIYAETSSREQYKPTQTFYERCGYTMEAVIKDFYSPGDSKLIFVKILPAPPPPAADTP